MNNNRIFQWVLLSVSIMMCSMGFGQYPKPIDYEELQLTLTEDENLYQQLKERYHRADTTLNIDDYRMLYYGFTLQEAYKPYERNPLDKEISDLMAESLRGENLEKLIQKTQAYLKQQPFSLKLNNYLQNFYKNSEDDVADSITILQKQYEGIIGAILSTGDGKTSETAYSINEPSDEYMVLRYLKLKPLAQNYESTIDFFTVKNQQNEQTTVYFDVTQMSKIGTAQMGIKTLEVFDDEIPEEGIEIGSRDEIFPFIPIGYVPLREINEDFDGDGDSDWLIVLKKEGEEMLSNSSIGEGEARPLLFLKRNEDKLLETVFRNDRAIPCVDCGGNGTDAFKSIDFKNNQLQIVTTGGNRFIWSRVSIFEFQGGEFVLIEDRYTSYRKGKEDEKQTDIETQEHFGRVTLQNYRFEE